MKRLVLTAGLALAASLVFAGPAAAQAPPPQPGTPPDATQPPGPLQRIVIAGVPRRCVRADFVARISLQPPEPPSETRGNSSTRVTLDFRRVLRVTPQASFGVRIPARRLRPGRHRIGVSITSRVGNLEELRGAKRFRRCR